jgi:hypothetical protein
MITFADAAHRPDAIGDGSGIRVGRNENGVISHHLVDHNNPTGYAQVLEEKSSTPSVSAPTTPTTPESSP